MASVGVMQSRPSALSGAVAALAVALIATVGLFLPAWQSMAVIWWNNETYTHGMLVPLVTLWLVWRKRDELAGLEPRPQLAALGLIALLGFGWIVGHLSGVNALQHFAVIGMAPALVLLCFGTLVTWRIAFPLAFLFFAVPFGDFMMPWLMDRTADFTVMAVQMSGVPVMREGRNFILPSGSWSVVEACSGLRYLLAAVPLGLLYAYLNFRSTRTRVVYVGLVMLIALVANWIRAYLIVMLGHVSNMKLAAGVDHLIYGWLFFGVVMGAVFWMGSHLPELGAAQAASKQPTDTNSTHRPPSSARMAFVSGMGILIMAAAPLAASALQSLSTGHLRLDAMQRNLSPASGKLADFKPSYKGSHQSVIGVSQTGAPVGVGVYQYVRQTSGSEMISHGNAATPLGAVGQLGTVRRQSPAASTALPGSAEGGSVNEYEIEYAGERWLVWEWFWIDGKVYSNPARVKLATASALLSGRGDESVAFVMWTPALDSLTNARDRIVREAARLVPAARAAGF